MYNPYRCDVVDAHLFGGQVQWNEAVFAYVFNDGPEARSDSDSAPFMPKGVVHQPHFDWSGDRRLQLPWHETVIYETHVKGLSARSLAVLRHAS